MQKKLLFLIVLFLVAIQYMNGQTHFGTGNDGALTIASGNVYYADQFRSPVVGDFIAGVSSIIVNDGSQFHQGDEILIMTMVDPTTDMNNNLVGQYETHYIHSVFHNELFLDMGLKNDYPSTGGQLHQVVKVFNFTNVVVNGEMTCSNWDGASGGVLVFRASGSVTISSAGKINVDGKGYRGHNRQSDNQNGYQGEGIFGVGVQSTLAFGNAGGGGMHAYGGGGGGGYAFVGGVGTSTDPGMGGLEVGDSTLTKLFMGGAGGTGGDNDSNNALNPNGGFGGGILIIAAHQLTNFGILSSNGSNGLIGGASNDGGSGGGAGGSILIQAYTFQNDSDMVAYGGIGYNSSNGDGGDGSVGRIRVFAQSFTNTGLFSPLALESNIFGIIHLPLANTSDVTGPYPINAIIIDAQGNTIVTANVHYRVNGGGWTTSPLVAGSNNSFSGGIAGQAAMSAIDYYISGSDGSDVYYSPKSYPADYHSFVVDGYPPSNFTVTDLNNGNIQLNWEAPTSSGNMVGYKIYRSPVSLFTPGPAYLIGTSVSDTFYVDNTASDFYSYYYRVGADYTFNIASSQEEHILVNNQNLTTVLGYAFLEGQSNHANIKIKFNPISPSAVLDSTYTNALGYFETTIVPGIYNVTYEKVNFQTYTRASNLSIIDDYDFGESTILMMGNANISGNVSGIWDGLYTISGDITVPNGDSLIINAGSEIRFLGNYNVYVYGYLLVDGVEADSVLFTSSPSNQLVAAGQWQGIDFYNNSDDNSEINYAIVRYAVDGIYVEEASISINHSKIFGCSDRGIQLNGDYANPHINYTEIFNCYDGIYNYQGQPNINFMNSHHNSRYGLYWDYYSYGSISNSTFSYNASSGMYIYKYSSPGVYDTKVTNNAGWGVDVRYYSSPSIQRCNLSYNTGYGLSTGYDGNGWHTTDVIDCIIEGNTSWGLYLRHYLTPASEIKRNLVQNNGGGMYLYYEIDAEIAYNKILNNNNIGIYFDNNHYCDPYIHHNIIAYNNGDGINRDDHYSSAIVKYNTIYGNAGDGIEVNQTSGSFTITNNIIANNNEYGLRSNKAVGVFEYNNIYSNGTGEISNTANLPVNSWTFVSYNAQNDSADIYLNISEDPLFLFAIDSLDLQLSSASPCINTGDPNVEDPNHTVSDIGAVYFDQGFPHTVYVDGYSNQTISLSWDSITIDSLSSYNVYYKLHTAATFSYFSNTSALNADVTGLTNDSLYDFTISGVYASFESGFAPKVSATPGVPGIAFDPESFNLTLTTDTLMENLLVTNNGSKQLHIEIPKGMAKGSTHFDGNSDFLYYSDPAHLENMTAFTMELWVYRQADGHMEFFGKHYRQYSMFIGNDNTFGTYKGYTSDFYESYNSGWVVPANEWHHLAITWEGTDMWFYADGEMVNHNDNVMPNAIPNLGYYFTIGARANEWSYDFNGFLSEVRIWNYARSQEQIQRYMNSSLPVPQTGLIGYWPLKTNYNDLSGNGVNFTSINGNVYTSASTEIGYDAIPYFLPNGESYDIPAASSLAIPFGFLNTGQTGTLLYTQHIYTNIPGSSDNLYEMALTFGQTVPSTPVHFAPVAATGLPYTIIITDAIVDGATIAIGDEIGVYDGNLCVGAGIFNGTFNFVLTVWQADPGNSMAGFTPGNTMRFVIYDTSADLEAPSDASYEVGDGTYGFNTFSALSLNGTVYIIQEVPITGGMFNLISFNLLPRHSAATTVFGALADMQIAYNDAGNALIPPYSINTIGDIYFKDGYHIYTNSTDTVWFEGTVIDPAEWPILVEANKWNSISYLGDIVASVVSAIDPAIVDSIAIVQASNGNAWIPSLSINTLGNFNPGLGYQIALSAQSNINLVYQVVNGSSKTEVPVQPESKYFKFAKTGLPYQIVVEALEINGQPLQPGDEIAVFDNDVCVGAAVFTGSSQILVTAWEGDSRTRLSGFEKGHTMSFKIYSPLFGELACTSRGLNSNDNEHFKAANFAHIEISPMEDVQTGFACYPNPFEDLTNISIYLEEESVVSLRVIDLSGRLVKVISHETLPSGIHTFTWNGNNTDGDVASSGVYFIEFNNGTESKTEKLIRIK